MAKPTAADKKKWRHGKGGDAKNSSITIDPAKNITHDYSIGGTFMDESFSGEIEPKIIAGEKIEEVVTGVSSDVYVPIGSVSSARMPGERGVVKAGYETNALDVIGETNKLFNINGTADKLNNAMQLQDERFKLKAENTTANVETTTAKVDAEVKADNTQKNQTIDTSNSAGTKDKTEKEKVKSNNDTTVKREPVPRETSTEKLQASLDLFNDANWDQNILHDYESVTYDLTLAIANKSFCKKFFDREAHLSYGYATDREFFETDNSYSSNNLLKTYDPGNTDDRVYIIARSAETITTINSFEFENVLGLTRADRVNTAFKFNMTITQPQSTNLIKQIFLASQELGIERYQVHPFFIQVYLKGRKKDGSLVGDYNPHASGADAGGAWRNAGAMNAAGQEIPGTRRLYAVFIKNMQYKVDVGGAVYQLEGNRYGDIARADDHALVSDIRIPKIKDFKDFTKKFTSAIVEQQKHELGLTKYLMDKYEVIVLGEDSKEIDEVLKSRIITDVENKGLILNTDLDSNNVTTEIDYDASITEVLEKHLTRTEYFVTKIKGVQESLSEINNLGKDELEKWDEIAVGKKAFTITPLAIPLKFDPLRNDYQRKLVYVIYISSWTSIQSGILQEYNAPPQRHKKRVSEMMQNASLTKKYSYHYTGDNLDVMDFDLTYNFQYVFPYDQLHGIFKNLPDALRDRILKSANDFNKHEKAKNEMKVDFDKMAEDGNISQSENRQILEARRFFLNQYREVLEDGTVEPDSDTLQAYKSLVSSFNNDILEFNKSVVRPGHQLLELKPYENLADNNQPNNTGAPRITVTGNKWRLAETLQDLSNKGSETFGKAIGAQFYARTMDQAGGTTDVGTGENAEAQRVIENAFAGGPSVDLMNVTMDIIGDPYWVPKPEIDQLDQILQDLGVSVDPKRENMVLFQTLYPKEVDKESGFIPPASARTDEILTSIYRVYKIGHSFANGQFTQRLHMQRDALTDLSFVTSTRPKKQGGSGR
jgi:hypothetical protein